MPLQSRPYPLVHNPTPPIVFTQEQRPYYIPFIRPLIQPSRELIVFYPEELQRIFPNIGQGTYGVVYKGNVIGTRLRMEGLVVIKDMKVENQQMIEDWKREVIITSKISSPFLADIFGYCWELPVVSIVMEYFPKGDLFRVLHKERDVHLSLLQRMRMARHCALGVVVLHKEGIIHRDIKSLNILVTEDYSCKLSDFGMAKLIKSDGGPISATLQYNTEGKGTPVWMAPEVKNPQQRVSQYAYPADVYSLGIVLFEVFERQIPWDDKIGKISMPEHYLSENFISPLINPNPSLRPTAKHVASVLDTLIRRTVMSVLELKDVHFKDQDLEIYLSQFYQHLLSKPPKEVDEMIEKALVVERKRLEEEQIFKKISEKERKRKVEKHRSEERKLNHKHKDELNHKHKDELNHKHKDELNHKHKDETKKREDEDKIKDHQFQKLQFESKNDIIVVEKRSRRNTAERKKKERGGTQKERGGTQKKRGGTQKKRGRKNQERTIVNKREQT